MKKPTIAELNELYEEADSIDKDTFAEQRSNVLLISGSHYSKRALDHFAKLRNSRDTTSDQKLRLTKNHTYRIVRNYVSNILDYAPGTTVVPHRDEEIQDQKVAELNRSVWENYFKTEYRIDELVREACSDFVGVGEVCYKISYDYSQGDIVGYEPKLDAEGNPEVDLMTGEQVADESRPVLSGRFVFDRIFAANLLRHPSAKSMRTSPCHIIRYMASVKDLKAKYESDPDKVKFIEESGGEEYVVFDTNKNSYERSKGQCLVREYYYRPCMEYPNGYYYITTRAGILAEDELPYGIYPVIWQGFDEYNTSPRAYSIVKIVRPYQAEINRAASSQAMAQVTLGDDKVLYQAGTKLAPGSLLPGVRGISYQGLSPTVLPGRDGGQFGNYIKDNIMEVDQAAMVGEISIEKDMGVDPMSALFQTVAQKKKYSIYIKKFEQFLVDLTMTALLMAKKYLPDDALIPSIGKAEFINIEEFRSSESLKYLVKVVPREDTLETQLGKQLMIQHALQYVGSQMEKADIGKLLVNLPYGNFKETFKSFTIDDDNVRADQLLLERGGVPRVGPYDNNELYVKELTHRMKMKDFQFLPPQVQQNYQMFLQEHEAEVARKAQEIKASESGYIPSGGAMVAADMYVPNEDPSKAPKRVRIPYEALNWLVEKLSAQGSSQEQMQQVGNQGALADIAGMVGGAGLSPQDQMLLQANSQGLGGMGQM